MGALRFASTEDSVHVYNDRLRTIFGTLDSKIDTRVPFKAALEDGNLLDLHFCRYTATAHRVERTDRFARQDERGCMKLALQIKGSAYFEQCGRGVLLSPGQWSIYDMAKPYVVTMPDETEILLLVIPRDKVASNRYNLADLTLRRFSSGHGIAKLAYQFIQGAFQEMPTLPPETHRDAMDTISHLIRLTMIQASGENATALPAQILCEQIKSYISTNLRDPLLSIDDMAVAFNCSKRYLHKAFEKEELSISEYIWRLRLERCRDDLSCTECQNMSVTDIAFSWGFNSSAHFSTAFKQQFGGCPRAFRPGHVISVLQGEASKRLRTALPDMAQRAGTGRISIRGLGLETKSTTTAIARVAGGGQ
jgi:AraC-like DNA-binding protein